MQASFDDPDGTRAVVPGPSPGDLSLLLPAIVAGLVGGLLALSASISYPAVIFTGALEPWLGAGIAMALFSSTVLGAIVALGSSYPPAIAVAQIETAMVLGAVATAITQALGDAAREVAFATLIATIILSTLSLGVVFVLLGLFRLGNAIRYIPFPVIGAFLAYIGWLLAQGGMTTMIGQPLTIESAPLLWQPDMLQRWLPGVVAAVGLAILQLKRRHYLNVPAVLMGAVAAFWLVAGFAGLSMAELQAAGHVLPALSQEQAWSPGSQLAMLDRVDWALVLQQLPQVVVIWLVAMITLLLSASSLEVASHSDIDLNNELKVTGVGNLVCSLGGGLPGYHSVSQPPAPLPRHQEPAGRADQRRPVRGDPVSGRAAAGLCAKAAAGPRADLPGARHRSRARARALAQAARGRPGRHAPGVPLPGLVRLRRGHHDRHLRRARPVRLQLCASRRRPGGRHRHQLREPRPAAAEPAPAPVRARRRDPRRPPSGLSVLRLGASHPRGHHRPSRPAAPGAAAPSHPRLRARQRRRFLVHSQLRPSDRAGRDAGLLDPVRGVAGGGCGRAAVCGPRSGGPAEAPGVSRSRPRARARRGRRAGRGAGWPGRPWSRPERARARLPRSRDARGAARLRHSGALERRRACDPTGRALGEHVLHRSRPSHRAARPRGRHAHPSAHDHSRDRDRRGRLLSRLAPFRLGGRRRGHLGVSRDQAGLARMQAQNAKLAAAFHEFMARTAAERLAYNTRLIEARSL